MKTTTKNGIENHQDVAARLELLKKQTLELEKQLAKGTGDVTAQARIASLSLAERIEFVLRSKPHSIEELANELKVSVGKITGAMKPLRNKLFNAGTEHSPAWFWIVGDSASTTEVNNAVAALVRYRPMRFPELLAAIGARRGRVSGAIVAMQRDPKSRIENFGTPAAARWCIAPEGATVSRLKPR